MTRYMKFVAFLVLAAKMAMAGSDHVALTGDGSTGVVSINPSGFKLTSATYTVEAWVWPSTLLKDGPIMDQFKGGTQGDWSLMVYAQPNENGKLALLSRGVTTDKEPSGPWFVSDSALPVQKWSHVAVAVDGSTIKFYINGKLDTTHTITSGSTLPTSSASFRIGSENRNNNRCFGGNLSDCRVWSAARQAGYSDYFPNDDSGYITDDHLFVNRLARIPMIDIVPYHPIGDHSFGPTWHTLQDSPDNIAPATLKAVGQTLLQLIFTETD